MQVKTGRQLHVFARGRDGGVDLTDDSNKHNIVVQVKHYEKSGFTALKNNLEKEIEKVEKLDPEQYFVCVSQSLTDSNVNTIYQMFSDYMESTNNILTLDDIDSFLHNPENIQIARNHTNLWLESGMTMQLLLECFPNIINDNMNNDNSADDIVATIKDTCRRKFYSDNAHSRDLHPARLDASGGMLIREDCSPKLLPDEFPKIKPVIDDMTSEEFPSNLFEYVEQHIADKTDSRHIYLSATSGSGKTTCLYGLWDKYLIDDTKYIPIYVAMHEVKGSLKRYICGEYLSQGTTISDFDWLKSPDFVKTQYHILLLLDGYNEIAVNMDPEIDETIKEEIKEILGFEHVSVVITSRDPINKIKASITNLKLCPLHPDQIKCLMGGHVEFLIEDRYEGILTNPFMLELCIKAFADDKNRLKSINEVSEEEIIREYLKKQIEGYKKEGKESGLGIELSPLDIIYIDVVLPLVAMKLDERKNTSGDRKTIGTDPKEYSWNDFSNAVMSVQEEFLTYRQLVKLIRPNTGGYNKKYTHIVSEEEDGDIRLLRRGVALELFVSSSEEKEYVKWDHEIYRDYFVARGYAIYCAYNEDFEDCVHNLAKQVNYRYPEPYEDKMDPYVDQVIREFHVRKAQMFIDMVDEKLDLNTVYLQKMKETAVYRRLTRDVAFIYEDLNSYKMARAAEVSMKYYSEDLEHYDTASKYDYPDRDRRYADAAYSISGLGYIWGHAKVSGDKTKRDYLIMEKDALERADRMFNYLEKAHSRVLEVITVQDDRVKKQGNWAAYYFTLSDVVRRENLEKSCQIHEANLEERKRIRKTIPDNNPIASMIDNSIAQTYIGIATAYFKLGRYEKAVENNERSINTRPEGKYQEIFTAHRNIVGAYTNMSDKVLAKDNKILDALKWIEKAFDYANEHDIHKDYKDLNDKADKLIRIVKDEKFVRRLSEETRSECQKKLESIVEKREVWAEKSLLRE